MAESTRGISSVYGSFLPSQRFDAAPRSSVVICSGGGLRPPVPARVGRPAGATVVRSCAGGRRVEIYDMCHTPGTYMPPTRFVAMTHDRYVQYNFYFWEKRRDFNARAGRARATETTRAANSNDNVEAGCMAPLVLLGSWTSVSWVARSKGFSPQLQLLFQTRTKDPSGKNSGFLMANNAFFKRGCFTAKK